MQNPAAKSYDEIKSSRKMRWWYESLADFMIAHPNTHQNDIATHFGRTAPTISLIINTDAFKAYFRQRRAQHAESLDSSVREKLFKVTDKSLDYMLEALDKKRDTIPIEMLQRVADSSLKNLGYGVQAPPGGVTVNVANQPQTVHVAVSLDDLQMAREALRRNQAQVIDVTPEPLPPQPEGFTEGAPAPRPVREAPPISSGTFGAAPPIPATLEDLE